MRIVVEKEKGIVSEEFDEYMGMLEDGKYLITIIPWPDVKTIRDLQNQYFLWVDTVSAHAGEDKYSIHEDFKRHQKVETTKDFSLQDWITFLDAFKWKQYNDYNIML